MNVEPDPRTTAAASREAHFVELESSRIRALLEADIGRLRRLHAADYQLLTPSGRTFTRERYIGLIESGQLRYLRWEPGPMEVRARCPDPPSRRLAV